MNQSSKADFYLTPDFLNPMLRATQEFYRAAIIDVCVEPLTAEVQFNAELCRLHLTCDPPGIQAPKTLIAKLPTMDGELHERAAIFQPGTRENWFYRSGAAFSPLNTPRCYYNQTDPATGESFLILEDLAPAHPGNWLDGATLEQAELALESLARFHAYWWGQADRGEIKELNGLLSDNWDAEQSLVQDIYDVAWPRFLAQRESALPEDVLRFGRAIVGDMAAVDMLAEQGPSTLVHGDYRLDNILFDPLDNVPTCWVVDWEDVYYGGGMIDVSWFLGGCLHLELTQHETGLLRGYHQALIEAGVGDYPWEACYQGYRRAMCSSFVQGVLSATLEGGASDYEYQLARVLGNRFVAAAQRLRLLDLMSS